MAEHECTEESMILVPQEGTHGATICLDSSACLMRHAQRHAVTDLRAAPEEVLGRVDTL